MKEYEFDVCPKCDQELPKNHPLLRPNPMKTLKFIAAAIAVAIIGFIVVAPVFERIG